MPQQKAGVDFGLNLGPLGSFNLGGNLGWDGISGNVAASVGPDGYLFDGNTGAAVGLNGISGNIGANLGPNGALAGANAETSIGLDGISGNVGANLAGANVGTSIGLGGIRAVPQQNAGVGFGLNLGPLGSFNLGGNLGGTEVGVGSSANVG